MLRLERCKVEDILKNSKNRVEKVFACKIGVGTAEHEPSKDSYEGLILFRLEVALPSVLLCNPGSTGGIVVRTAAGAILTNMFLARS